MIELRPEFRFSNQIWPNLPRFGLFCLDLAYFAWIWVILLGFGPFCLDLGPKGDEALRMGQGGDGRTDGQIPPVFYRTSSPLGPLPKNEQTK